MEPVDLLSRTPGEIGVDPARQHRVGLDVVGGPGDRAGARELHDAAFAGGVSRREAGAEDRHHRADIDDLTTACFLHRRVDRLRAQECAGEIGLMTLSHSSRSSACGDLRMLMPALLTRMSIRPNSRLTRSTMAVTAALSATSAATDIALALRCWSSAIAAADFASLRPTIAMPAPASAKPRAMPRPMPPLPPVTMATLPLRSNCDVFIVGPLAFALPDQDEAERGQ